MLTKQRNDSIKSQGQLHNGEMDMQGVRNQADYPIESVSKNLAFQQISKAKEMISAIGEELEK